MVWAYPFLADRRAVPTDNEFLRRGREVGQTADGQVFVVQAGIVVDSVIGLGVDGRESVKRIRSTWWLMSMAGDSFLPS